MEVSFEAARRVRQECAQPVIVHFYSWLLQGYRSNAAFTNHSILSFFRRIAEPQQLNLEPMLYQVGACVYVALLCVAVALSVGLGLGPRLFATFVWLLGVSVAAGNCVTPSDGAVEALRQPRVFVLCTGVCLVPPRLPRANRAVPLPADTSMVRPWLAAPPASPMPCSCLCCVCLSPC
jgi:hypothetical protein